MFIFKKQKIKTKITYIHRYKTVEYYLRRETLKKALPCVKTIKDGVKIYNLWTSEKERDKLKQKYGYGFLGIGIKRI